MRSSVLAFIVFTTGACVMILELVGSRILAPYLGTSIVVWTSLIGIILGSLSIGYYAGGVLADKRADEPTFSLLLVISSLLVTLLGFIKLPLLEAMKVIHDPHLGSILATILLFTPASIVLGTISPYAVKLKLRTMTTSGATVGTLYAISTIGSIVGTFLAGFTLIVYFGNSQIIYLVAIILALLAVLAHHKSFLLPKIVAVVLAGIGMYGTHTVATLAHAEGVIDVDTRYTRAMVFPTIDHKTGRPIRALVTGPYTIQSAMFLDGDDDLVFDYTKFYRLATHFHPQPKNTLLLGGAGYSFPKDFLKKNPESAMTVVEIDPGLTALAKQYFQLPDDPRLSIVHEDGRTFLNRTSDQYDILYGDAFQSIYSIPYQLATKEAVQHMHDHLSDDGVAIINIISGIQGPRGKFFRAELATFRSVFPQVYVFQTLTDRSPDEVQNLILVALKSKTPASLTSKNPEIQSYLDRLFTTDIPSDLPILTDEHAPVDQYLVAAQR